MGHSATGGNHGAPSTLPQGWHPSEPGDDVALLRSELDACRAEIARLRAAAAKATEVGVDYCTTHNGIRNEDMDACDFADMDDGPCRLRPLFYLPEERT